MATFFLDYENGNDNYSGTSFALLASGTDGRTNNYTFTAATANFPNNGTIAATKNLFGSSERYDNNNAWGGQGFDPKQIFDEAPPSGLYTVWRITEQTNSAAHSLRYNSNIYSLNTSVQHTVSFYVKPNGRNIVVLRFGASDTKGARFDIANGTILQTGASATSAISDAGNGWYRISVTATPSASNDIIYFNLTDGTYTGTGEQSYTGNGVFGVLVSGAQLEVSSSVTSYEKPPCQYLSIFNGSIYAVYEIVNYISSTSLYITSLSAGAAVGVISVDRQYYIGGRWKNLSSSSGATAARLQTGDTLRLKASPDPTSIGNATWTGGMMPATKALNVGTTNTSPITVTLTSHGYSTGDTVYITGHGTNLNANGMWQITVTGTNTFTLNGSTGSGTGGGSGTVRLKNNAIVTLASPLTQNIASIGNRGNLRTVWTPASANVTTLFDSGDSKEGDVADYVGVNAAFTTGKAAYKTLESTLDLSGYQQLSLWFKLATGTLNSTNDLSIVLCSDTTGDVPVNTFNIPPVLVLNKWAPITIDLGTNLGSSIRSVAIYVNIDRGAQVYYMSNIIACKAASSPDSLNLQSLIGKNTTGETWYGIQSINGTRVVLDMGPSAKASDTFIRGYFGTSGTTETFKRETIKTTPATSATSVVQAFAETHFTDNIFTYIEGGWNRTDMSTQTGETVFDGLNGFGQGVVAGNNTWGVVMNKIGCVRYFDGIYHHTACRFTKVTNCFGNNNDARGVFFTNQSNHNILNNLYCFCNSSVGISITTFSNSVSITNCVCNSNGFDGIGSEINYGLIDSCILNNNGRYGCISQFNYKNTITNCTATYNQQYSMYFSRSSDVWVKNLTSIGNQTGSIGGDSVFVGISDSDLQESVLFGTLGFNNSKAHFQNLDQVEGNHFIGLEYGSIYSSSAVTRSGSGYSWALAPTSNYRSSVYPLDLKVSTFAVAANKLVSISAWVRRTNMGLTCRLRIPGGQIGGISSDLISYATGAADTWEQVTINFIPTENGVIDLFFEVYGGSTYTGYIDDLSIVQL